MSRGGFGGGRNIGGNMGGTKLPFDVDPDLEKEVLEYDATGNNAEEKDAKSSFVWPVRINHFAKILKWRSCCFTVLSALDCMAFCIH